MAIKLTDDGKANVAAILAAARLAKMGGPKNGASTYTAYVEEFREMLHALNHGEDRKPRAAHDPL